jgi:hypothetical protein
MIDKSHTRIEKMKSGVFSHNDIVKIGVSFEDSGAKDYCENITDLIENIFLKEIEDLLKTGVMWKFNPSCLKLFISNNSFEYNKDALVKDICENCEWDYTELDKNTHFFSLSYDIELLLINAVQINESIIEDASYITIQNLVGEIEI